MKRRKWIILLALVALLLILKVTSGIDFWFRNGIHIVYKRAPIDVASPSGQYRLVESVDYSGRCIIISIMDKHSLDILYTADYAYPSRYATNVFWSKMNDDFWVITSDIGWHYYRFANDSWSDDNWVGVDYSEDNKTLTSAFVHVRNDGTDDTVIALDLDDIPDEVLKYMLTSKI